jgi:hypothetical protein
MACKICRRTMQGLGNSWWHCPSCGSLMHRVHDSNPLIEDWTTPTVADRARQVYTSHGSPQSGFLRDLGECVGLYPDPQPAPRFSLDTIDGKIEAADLHDETERLMLADALEECGREEEARDCRTTRPSTLVKEERDGHLYIFDLPF